VSASTIPHLAVEAVTQRFGTVTALDGISLAIQAGEFVTLLGPSGCGKTTLLRIVAGFQRPTEGRVLLDGRDVTRTPPHKRPVNYVFQRPTLFPHLDVHGNVAFGLRIARLDKEAIDARVSEALQLVRLAGFEKRHAHELSGGQMQRVALARALVNQPKVLLLDEPLSALDLKIRLDMEAELRRVHRETGATFVYVTHDQREALALSDRIAVFDAGRIEQLGTPEEIYRRPQSPFTASFVGDANVIPCTVTEVESDFATVRLGAASLQIPSADTAPGSAWLVIRPERVSLRPPDGRALTGTVLDVAFRGTGRSYKVDVEGLENPIKAEVSEAHGAHEVGSTVALDWNSDACRLLPRS
jgi:heme ABC exporter ATP-binding subunit CcmA